MDIGFLIDRGAEERRINAETDFIQVCLLTRVEVAFSIAPSHPPHCQEEIYEERIHAPGPHSFYLCGRPPTVGAKAGACQRACD